MEAPLSPSPAPAEKNPPVVQPTLHETIEDYESPGERKLDRERRIAWRVGAVLILLNMLMNVATLVFGFGASSGPAAIAISGVIDVVIAINLFRDRKWARDLAVARLALGLVVYGIMNGVSGGIVAVLVTALTVGAILLVLVGESRTWRTVVGSIAFAVVFFISLAGLAVTGFASRVSGLSVDSMNLLGQAQAAMKDGDFPKAIDLYGQLTRAEPDSAVAFYGLCSAYQESGNGILAIDACDTAAELAPKDSNILSYRAYVLLTLERHEEALAASEAALTINDKDYFGHFIRGASRYALGEVGYEEDFARSLELAPTEQERAAFQDAITRMTGE